MTMGVFVPAENTHNHRFKVLRGYVCSSHEKCFFLVWLFLINVSSGRIRGPFLRLNFLFFQKSLAQFLMTLFLNSGSDLYAGIIFFPREKIYNHLFISVLIGAASFL